MYISLLIVWGSSALYLLSISITYMRHGSLIYWWLNTRISLCTVHYLFIVLNAMIYPNLFIYIRVCVLIGELHVYNTDERVCTNRLAMDTFWRTFHHDGINSAQPAAGGGGSTPSPFQPIYHHDTLLLFLLYPFLLCCQQVHVQLKCQLSFLGRSSREERASDYKCKCYNSSQPEYLNF